MELLPCYVFGSLDSVPERMRDRARPWGEHWLIYYGDLTVEELVETRKVVRTHLSEIEHLIQIQTRRRQFREEREAMDPEELARLMGYGKPALHALEPSVPLTGAERLIARLDAISRSNTPEQIRNP